ncbi:SDR family oxidoreductase [Bacillus shivajii]|uniref:elongation factor P 5-aminopentanone reductase n=1 Tax=Bacillus shivajii TaxID=1983719 RepID=UPI001CF93045|nr:SDR family oxidoreductase [Bacillus shivajii]UCZ51663.1 SDR family oxidoreductase [Bacillus shivajii]
MKQTAFISGASGDIGGEIAKSLAEKGYSLILHYCQNEKKVQKLANNLHNEYGVDYVLFQADFANPTEVSEKINQLPVAPDVLVHNSGTSHVGMITDTKQEEVIEQMNIGLTSPFFITQALLPKMIRQKHGKIIVISSIWGLTGASCEVLYSMIKGGMNTFVKALAKEVALSGIQVNGVAPGAIDTKMLDLYSDEELDQLTEEIPAGRLGKPKEVAELVSFLCSDHSSYINGQIISVNGAWYS